MRASQSVGFPLTQSENQKLGSFTFNWVSLVPRRPAEARGSVGSHGTFRLEAKEADAKLSSREAMEA